MFKIHRQTAALCFGEADELLSMTVVCAVVNPRKPAPHLQVLLPRHDAVDRGSVWKPRVEVISLPRSGVSWPMVDGCTVVPDSQYVS